MARIVWVTNVVTAYRAPVYAALARRWPGFVMLVEQEGAERIDAAAGAELGAIPVRRVRHLVIPRERTHPDGFRERVPVHLPYTTLAQLVLLGPRVVLSNELGLRTLWAVVYRVLFRRRLVVHVDVSDHTEKGRGRARHLLRELLLRGVDRVIVNGEGGRRYMRSAHPWYTAVDAVPYTSDVEALLALPREPRPPTPAEWRLVYVGRLIPLKGLGEFIGFLGELLVTRPEVRATLTLIGDGPLREELERQPLPRNLRLNFVGRVPHAALGQELVEQDVFVLPTLSDTWGTVVNEAMAAGLPVLGSVRSQAVEELVEDGVSGWRFDPLDPASVRGALVRCWEDRARSAGMGEAARETARRLSPAEVAARIDAVVNRLGE